MHDRDPQNKAVVDALQYAENNKKYQIARAQVVKKVDETKKMIEELKRRERANTYRFPGRYIDSDDSIFNRNVDC